MIVHDDAFQDSLAVFALGALPESEAREIAAHLRECASCRTAYDEFRSAANLVGYAAEAPAGTIDELAATRMKSTVMRNVRASLAPPAPPVTRPNVAAWLGYAAAAAALIVAFVSHADNATLRAAHDRDARRIADLHALQSQIAALVAPESKHYAIPGGSVVTSGGRIFLAMRALPPPPLGKVYQAWTLARGAKTVAPSVTFVPNPSGVTLVELPERSAGLAAVAVTIEPTGGSKVPTSKPAFVRPLS
jgi:hypothetical protein